MPKVIIDDVEYIPAKEALANEESIARGLLMQFWGECTDEDLHKLIGSPSICVYVGDNYGEYTLRSVLDEIAKQS